MELTQQSKGLVHNPELWGERNAQRVVSPVTNEERNDHERVVIRLHCRTADCAIFRKHCSGSLVRYQIRSERLRRIMESRFETWDTKDALADFVAKVVF